MISISLLIKASVFSRLCSCCTVTVFVEGDSPLKLVEFQSSDSGENGGENADHRQEEEDQELEPRNPRQNRAAT